MKSPYPPSNSNHFTGKKGNKKNKRKKRERSKRVHVNKYK